MSYYPNEALALKRLARADALAYIARIQETQPPKEQLAMLRMKALHMVRPMPETWGSSFYEPVVEEDILLLHSKDRESDIRRHIDHGSDVHLAGEVYDWFDSYIGSIAHLCFEDFDVYDTDDDGYHLYYEAYPIFLMLTSEKSRALLRGLAEFVVNSGHLDSDTYATFKSAFCILADDSADASSVIRTIQGLPFQIILGFSRAIEFAMAQQTLLGVDDHPELKPSAIDLATKDVSIYDVFAVAKRVLPPLPFSQFVWAFDFGYQYGSVFHTTLMDYANYYLRPEIDSPALIAADPILSSIVLPKTVSESWPPSLSSESDNGNQMAKFDRTTAVREIYKVLHKGKIIESTYESFSEALLKNDAKCFVKFRRSIPKIQIAFIIEAITEIFSIDHPRFRIKGYTLRGNMPAEFDYVEDLLSERMRPDSERQNRGRYEIVYRELDSQKEKALKHIG